MDGRIVRSPACRPRPNQFGVIAQQPLKCREVAVDDGLDRGLEESDGTVWDDGVDIFGHGRPVGEGVPPRQREARVVEIEGRLLNVFAAQKLRPPLDGLVQEPGVVLVDDSDGRGIAGPMSLDQITRLPFVVFERGAKGKRVHLPGLRDCVRDSDDRFGDPPMEVLSLSRRDAEGRRLRPVDVRKTVLAREHADVQKLSRLLGNPDVRRQRHDRAA